MQQDRTMELQQDMALRQDRSGESFAGALSKSDISLLQKFRNKVDKFKHTLCPVCNESFPSIVLVKGECRRCYTEKASPKKFSAENNTKYLKNSKDSLKLKRC